MMCYMYYTHHTHSHTTLQTWAIMREQLPEGWHATCCVDHISQPERKVGTYIYIPYGIYTVL